jgi:hypothetical protein
MSNDGELCTGSTADEEGERRGKNSQSGKHAVLLLIINKFKEWPERHYLFEVFKHLIAGFKHFIFTTADGHAKVVEQYGKRLYDRLVNRSLQASIRKSHR